MTPAQLAALEACAGRKLTDDELAQAEPLLDPENRNYVALAALVSTGRTRVLPTEIGVGTILAALNGAGGVFLDTLVAVGEQNRDVFWTMDLIRQGRLRIDMPATRAGMQGLAAAVPQLADGIAELLKLGVQPDPVSEFDVRVALVEPWTARQTDFGVHPGKRMVQATIVYTSASGEEITETTFADNLDAAAVRRIVAARIASLNARTAALESLTEVGNGPVA